MFLASGSPRDARHSGTTASGVPAQAVGPAAPSLDTQVAVGTLGHELRNALLPVRASCARLRDTTLGSDQASHLATIEEFIEHALTVVDATLESTRTAGGPIVLHDAPLPVDDLLRSCASAVASMPQGAGVTLRVEPGQAGVVLVDVARVRQVVLNLLSNAAKFAQAGTVTAHATLRTAPAGTHLVVTVQDNGIGLHPRDLPSLFQPFRQGLQPKGSPWSGSGLGLAASRALCRRMGGDLTAQGQPGRGSTFTATFAVRPTTPDAPSGDLAQTDQVPDAKTAPVPGMPREGGPRLRILLADDNSLNRRFSEKVVRDLGHDVQCVPDGEIAVMEAVRHRFDVILMDVHMPGIGGLEATRQLRRRLPPGEGLLIIGLTADAGPQDRGSCLAAGMDEHLPKPLDGDILARTLQAHFRARRAILRASEPEGVLATATESR